MKERVQKNEGNERRKVWKKRDTRQMAARQPICHHSGPQTGWHCTPPDKKTRRIKQGKMRTKSLKVLMRNRIFDIKYRVSSQETKKDSVNAVSTRRQPSPLSTNWLSLAMYSSNHGYHHSQTREPVLIDERYTQDRLGPPPFQHGFERNLNQEDGIWKQND